ncbi:hypothetical protein BH11PAT2_BH11PAT2_01600 [soil metagenome]
MTNQEKVNVLLSWLKTNIPVGPGILIPVSGGSDSALCFWLCNQVFKEHTKGISIGTELRSKEWFDAVGEVVLHDAAFVGENPEVARWAHFLTVCLAENRILLGSRNHTESILGTFSNASRVATFFPLAGLWKHEVMELCDFIGIPEEITASSKRADPECGRPEKMADIQYEAVDRFLQEKRGAAVDTSLDEPSPEQREYLENVYAQNSYKADLPLVGPITDIR